MFRGRDYTYVFSHGILNIEDTKLTSVKKGKSCNQRITFIERQAISSYDYVLDIRNTTDNLLGISTECNLPLLSGNASSVRKIVGLGPDNDE